MPTSVCLVASEATPYAKTGGLADVAGALAKFLHGAGHDVRLFVPLHRAVDRAAHGLAPLAGFQDLPLEFGGHRFRYGLQQAALPRSGAPVYFIDCPALFDRPALYSDAPDEHLRYLALTRAALESCQRMGWAPAVLHCNDWHTAFGPLLLRTAYAWDKLFTNTRSVLTIHNIGYQGVFDAARAGDVGLADLGALHQDELRAGRVNPLRHGILYADAITTVSPTYAREILTPEYGMGLEDSLRARAGALTGILNGVDYDDWDPRHDRWLPRHYDADRLDVKASLKTEFLERFRLRHGPSTALLGIVSRLAEQKGFDLLASSAASVAMLTRDACLVVLGSGEPRYEAFFTTLQHRFPQRVVFHRGYDEALAHWIEAAADIFLMPSRYEPCGLNQMYSLRYGTIPVVRRTGGLADSVRHYDEATGEGTGVVFDDYDAPALAWGIGRALDLYRRPEHWTRLVRNAMAEDFSWERQGAEYARLYARLSAA
jgi:starch synthase